MATTEARTDGLLAQHMLLLAIIDSDWATRLDHKVGAVIIQRYYSQFKNARASLRFISVATRADRTNVIDSVRRLVENGAFSVIREGKGTRPTEYGLNFDFCSSGGADTTANDDLPSGGADATSCGGTDTTTRHSSGGADATESYLLKPAYKAGVQVDRKFEAAPVAPPTAGLAAAAAGPASGGGDGFTEFWKAWPRKHSKTKAHAEWEKLAPDADMTSHIIVMARTWARHYAANGTEAKWIPEPANWLKLERYDEDLPIIHGDAKGAVIAKAKANAPPKPAAPKGDRVVDIADSDVVRDGMETTLTVTFVERDTPHTWTREFQLESSDMDRQWNSQKELSELCRSVGLQTITDSSELHFRSVMVLPRRDGSMNYSRAANDNHAEAA